MPGEFEHHFGCWMLWPERPDVWREDAAHARRVFCHVAEAISQFEPVTVGVRPHLFENARQMLPENIRLQVVPYDDAWARDNGPTYVINNEGTVRGIDWDFNAWGGLYEPWNQDELTAQGILNLSKVDRYKAEFVLEGGSIHVDGEGTCITTEECLLNSNRNPGLSKEEIDSRLKAYLNVDKVIWIRRGVFEDETSGHVDNLCCFARPGEVVLTWTDDEGDPQYEISREAYDVLTSEKDAQGRSLKVYPLHQPTPMHITKEEADGLVVSDSALGRPEGQRLAASYVNFYIANGGIVMPLFNDPAFDDKALKDLQAIFPDRKVAGVYSREVLLGGGNIHCITQQQPAAVSFN